MKAAPLKKCPECGKLKLKKQIVAPMFKITNNTTQNQVSGGDHFGYVKKTQDDMKKVGDLANFNRDKMSKWQKEAADKEYADSSRLAAAKLDEEKNPIDRGFMGASEKTMKKLENATLKQKEKYIATGEI
jgi:hypothetical protein